MHHRNELYHRKVVQFFSHLPKKINYHCFLDWVGIGGLHIHFHSIAGMSVTAVLRCIVSYTLSSSSFFKAFLSPVTPHESNKTT